MKGFPRDRLPKGQEVFRPTRNAQDSASVLTRYTGGYDYFLEKSGLNDDRGAVTA
jgi:hypothetical protein